MRDPNRIGRTLELVRAYWLLYPDLRLGQLVDNVASVLCLPTFYMEDDKLMEFLTKELAEAATPKEQ